MDLLTFQIKVREGGTDWGWGVVVNVVKKPSGGGYIVDTLLHCSPVSNENSLRPKPCPPRPGEKGEMHVVSSHFKLLLHFSWLLVVTLLISEKLMLLSVQLPLIGSCSITINLCPWSTESIYTS